MSENRSKSGLFLIELLIVIAVFAVCAAICVRLFAAAYISGLESRDTGRAITVAKNHVEHFKATGDIGQRLAYYSENWIPHSNENGAAFKVVSSPLDNTPLSTYIVTVSRVSGEELVSLTVASSKEVPYG